MIGFRQIALVMTAAAVAALAGGAAVAQDCPDKTRKYSGGFGSAAVHTVVENTSKSAAFNVAILRNNTRKSVGEISADNPQISALMKGARGGLDVTVDVRIRSAADSALPAVACTYNVFFDGPPGGAGTAEWTNQRADVCQDITKICQTCKLTCTRQFHDKQGRWNVKLTIAD